MTPARLAADLLHHIFPWEPEGHCVEGVGAEGEAASSLSAERPPVAPSVTSALLDGRDTSGPGEAGGNSVSHVASPPARRDLTQRTAPHTGCSPAVPSTN